MALPASPRDVARALFTARQDWHAQEEQCHWCLWQPLNMECAPGGHFAKPMEG